MSYDSMGQRHDDVCSLLLLYLKEEHRAKRGRELDSPKWTVGSLRAAEIPQQRNGSDCGVFVCKYADYIAKGRPLTFKQSVRSALCAHLPSRNRHGNMSDAVDEFREQVEVGRKKKAEDVSDVKLLLFGPDGVDAC
ncbi:Sentrin-specific protease 2 [Liparis tanakae]|uniref:Sentrin-specific protease 2 n=1 Tax=Liparis tanakae TaxID=230148 RepID=A0A4Z2ETB9_9TELE|nr:Sentrin-specific protease 2 [Liparis tanakae]